MKEVRFAECRGYEAQHAKRYHHVDAPLG
jgi:hypothetical protein